MRRGFLLLALLALGCTLRPPPPAPFPVSDVRLLDHAGVSHQLSHLRSARALVFIWHGVGCPIVAKYAAEVNRLQARYRDEGVLFFWVNANPQDTLEDLAQDAVALGIAIPVLKDQAQFWSQSVGVSRTASAVIVDPRTLQRRYLGAINDQVGFEVTHARPREHYLSDALDQVLAGQVAADRAEEIRGCLINYLAPRPMPVTYVRDVAPILQQRCLGCHQKDGMAPWAMDGFDRIRGWAPMMKEVVLTKRMPPWNLDPRHGKFRGDLSLSPEQERTLLTWVTSGAPRGEGPDPLVAAQATHPLKITAPADLMLSIGESRIPAQGPLPWQFREIKNPLKRDVWLRGSSFTPGNRKVVHHALFGLVDPSAPPPKNAMEVNRIENLLGGYSPNYQGRIYPAGSGKLLRAGQTIRTEIHYTTTGRAEEDTSQLAFYFHKKRPRKIFRHARAYTADLAIPPHARNHRHEGAPVVFEQDVQLHDVRIHMHQRGRSCKIVARLPNGHERTLISVVNYSYNWQHVYSFERPIPLPAGTRLVPIAIYDNSTDNPLNPDPDQHVRDGYETSEEMLFITVGFINGREWAGP
jgi:hypothetical protein